MEQKSSSDPGAALQLSQKAPTLLAKSASVSTTFPFNLLNTNDSPELWTDLEQLFYACLRVEDDKSAHLCLERLTQRFGAENERIMAMRGLYQEAVASDETTLKSILQDYNKILSENPMNVPVHKRRIALVRALGRPQEAITSLVDFLESFPTDIEAWCELSDLYQSLGFGAQAIFCLEEALLTAPNAWNLHARLGELEYISASASTDSGENAQKSLIEAIQRFSRSIELCDNYLRGYYGLKLAADKLLQSTASSKSANGLSREKLQKLSKLASSKLESIIKANAPQLTAGVNEAELAAAQELLDRSKR